MMKAVKTAIRQALQRRGYDIVPYGNFGLDATLDFRYFLNSQEKPMIFDVGANLGQSVDWLGEAFPGARIHSFEPSPSTYEKLKEHCSPLSNVKAWNYGVGSADGTLQLKENNHSDMSSFLDPGATSWGNVVKTTEVQVVTLDSFARQQGIDFIHLLKSDTQGYDFEVFKGAKTLLSQNKIALIYFEVIFSDMYAGQASFHDVFRFLQENNYALVTLYRPFFQNDLVSWTDALFINREFKSKMPSTGNGGPFFIRKSPFVG